MISKEEVQKLAELARLELSEKEVTSLQKEMSDILDYVGQVAAVSIHDAAPQAGTNRNVVRADVPRADGDILSDKREALLAALPKREGDYNVVRKIIQKDE
jgi:aspartyl-tRNA(Asn)/glutamyl-tRNA(Gln) amidotransferase subunit C